MDVKNKGNDYWATKKFRVSGSLNENGPWRTLIEEKLADTRYLSDADLVDFTFDHPVEIQFLKFELVSYWGEYGGALQYFAAIHVRSELYSNYTVHHLFNCFARSFSLPKNHRMWRASRAGGGSEYWL